MKATAHHLRSAVFAITFLFSSVIFFCGQSHPRRTKFHPNVILISIDTVRADHLPCYGDQQIETPTLDALARDGVVFDRAVSQVPLTWPSHAVILTGTYPFQNGVQDFTGHPLSPYFRTLAQAFKSAGYATGAVVSSFVLDRSWGLARGFDYYDDAFAPGEFRERDLGSVERNASESVSRALDWLKTTHPRPFFLWLHLYDPHSPYAPPEPYRTRYQDRPYDGEIAYADHELGRLISWLKQQHLYDNSTILMLSDHGESLGEHGESEHGFFIYRSTTHIPLIVKPPTGSGIRSGRNTSPVETTAVVQTLMQLANLQDAIQQQSGVTSLFDSQNTAPGAYSETFYPFSSFGWSPLHSIETEKYHYIDAPKPELYDLQSDPQERNNLASEQPSVAAILKTNLQKRLSDHPLAGKSSGDPSPDAVAKLRALGYVAYQSPVTPETLAKGLADPKDKLSEFNSILQAQDAFRAGKFENGEKILEQVESSDPQMYVLPFLLGEAAVRQSKWEEASRNLKRSLELNPNFDEAMTGLAHVLRAQNDDAGAQDWLKKAININPRNYRAWYEMAGLRAPSNHATALEDYRKAISIQPNFAQGLRDLGVLEIRQKQYLEGSQHLERAVSLGLDDAHLRNFLGIAYTQTNHIKAAVRCLQEAIRQDSKMAEAHLNLGFAYQKMHRIKLAKQEYDAACRLQNRFCGVVPNTAN